MSGRIVVRATKQREGLWYARAHGWTHSGCPLGRGSTPFDAREDWKRRARMDVGPAVFNDLRINYETIV